MASYQKHYDDQGRKVDEYGNVERQTDEYGNPVHATSVTYVATKSVGGYNDDANKQHDITGVYPEKDTGRHHFGRGYDGDTNKQHDATGVYPGIDIGRDHGTTGVYGLNTDRHHGSTGVNPGIDTHNQQHGTTGGYAGDTGRQHGNTGGLYYGTDTADTGAGSGSGNTGGTGYGGTGGTDYGTAGGTGYGSGTGYGINTGGAHTEAGYGKEHRQHEQSHGGQHEKKGILDKIKEKLPGGHSDK
uniref:Dehydrin n=1 Tax=Glycine max TaxID=3847 RepID=Q70EL7_SOYBN|nr:dehydrin [Glycine max]